VSDPEKTTRPSATGTTPKIEVLKCNRRREGRCVCVYVYLYGPDPLLAVTFHAILAHEYPIFQEMGIAATGRS
jgi:hypothetical protein